MLTVRRRINSPLGLRNWSWFRDTSAIAGLFRRFRAFGSRRQWLEEEDETPTERYVRGRALTRHALFKREAVEFDTSTKVALRRLTLAALTLVLLMFTTYGAPFLERFRPWIPGEPVPLARLFTHYDSSLLPSFAEASTTVAPDTGAYRKPESVPMPKSTAGWGATSKTQISPDEIEGITQFIEDPGGRALLPFYAALLRTAKGENKAVTRIAHFGDSAVAADSIACTMRRQLQARFGDAGHGYILISPGDMHYYHMDISQRASKDWELYPIVLISLGDDWYGLGGVQYRSTLKSWARFATVDRGDIGRQVSRFEVFYQKYPGGGKLLLKLDGKLQEVINTKSPRQEDAWAVVEAADGPHALSISTSGGNPVRLYGVTLERDVAGVVYDSLGMVGGQAERLLRQERVHLSAQLDHRSPDLIILGFGGNEAENHWVEMSRYEKVLRNVLKHIRDREGKSACLLFAPLDQAERDGRGEVRTLKQVPQIVEVQRRVALSEGCAFFDTYSAMGGNGSMLRWYRKRPRLATSDFRHATTSGYEVIGDMFYKALLKGFADYLQRNR